MDKITLRMNTQNNSSKMEMRYDGGYYIGSVSVDVNSNSEYPKEKLENFLAATAELYDEIVLGNSKHYRAVFRVEFVKEEQ